MQTGDFVVLVSILVKSGCEEVFLTHIRENARASLLLEEGCRQFDILQATDSKEQFFLYEVYDDEAAFELHLGLDHSRKYNSACADLIAEKSSRRGIRQPV